MISEPNSSPPSPQPPAAAPLALPAAWINARQEHASFWPRLAVADHCLLICDYDGTLAPFKADKMQAVPYSGVAERLEKIAAQPRSKLALVSGRPVAELITLLPLASQLELFGSHGREHRSASGGYRLEQPSPPVREALDTAAAELATAGWERAIERKAASIAVHWRSLSRSEQTALAEAAGTIFAMHTSAGTLSILPFESGLELRANDHTKAHAVEQLLRPASGLEPAGLVAAYLGDDTTDEDAFGALGTRGLSLLVREEPRASLASYWLRPPAQLLGFLDDWLRAVSAGT